MLSCKLDYSGLTFCLESHPLLAKFLFARADGVAIVSEGAAQDFISHFPFLRSKVKVIYNPVITDQIDLLMTESNHHPFFREVEPVVLAVGRLVKSKNFDVLIAAFQLVREQMPSKLIILGDGPERKRLEVLIKAVNMQNVVSMPGESLNPYSYYSKAHVAVLSSAYEGLPAVLIEALYCGCNVVSTDCPHGPSEILENGKFGTLVPVDDVHAIAEAIVLALHKDKADKGKLRALDYHASASAGFYLRWIQK